MDNPTKTVVVSILSGLIMLSVGLFLGMNTDNATMKETLRNQAALIKAIDGRVSSIEDSRYSMRDAKADQDLLLAEIKILQLQINLLNEALKNQR